MKITILYLNISCFCQAFFLQLSRTAVSPARVRKNPVIAGCGSWARIQEAIKSQANSLYCPLNNLSPLPNSVDGQKTLVLHLCPLCKPRLYFCLASSIMPLPPPEQVTIVSCGDYHCMNAWIWLPTLNTDSQTDGTRVG